MDAWDAPPVDDRPRVATNVDDQVFGAPPKRLIGDLSDTSIGAPSWKEEARRDGAWMTEMTRGVNANNVHVEGNSDSQNDFNQNIEQYALDDEQDK